MSNLVVVQNNKERGKSESTPTLQPFGSHVSDGSFLVANGVQGAHIEKEK